VELKNVVMLRNNLADIEKKVYMNAMTQLNTKTKELLDTNIGNQLIRSCARDLSGQVVRRYFDLGDLYITADQLHKRIVSFDYKDEYDPLATNAEYHKEVLNYHDDKDFSSTLKDISMRNVNATKVVFEGERKGNEPFYSHSGKKYQSRTDYKNRELNPGDLSMKDDLTGQTVRKETIEGDHIRAVKSATYNSKYLGDEYIAEMQKIYNSEDNMQWINARANESKGKADSVEATIQKWENAAPHTKEELQKRGYLDGDGKVTKHVKKELERNFRHISNVESTKALKHANYGEVSKDAGSDTAKSMGKIITGQIIYYVLPPLAYEVKAIISKGRVTLESFFQDIKKAGKRVLKYVYSKLLRILKDFLGNSVKKFLKTFFDILISIVKDTVKRCLQMVKDLVLALVDSVKIMLDKNATRAQKADAVFNLISVTIANFAIMAILEYMEKQFALPAFIVEAIELLAVVITSNLVMIILQKLDLFDVRYGFMMANMEKIFEETSHYYDAELSSAEERTNAEVVAIMDSVNVEIKSIKERLSTVDFFSDTIKEDIEKINRIFDMRLNLDSEWKHFLGVAN
jgi:hypothetical protein